MNGILERQAAKIHLYTLYTLYTPTIPYQNPNFGSPDCLNKLINSTLVLTDVRPRISAGYILCRAVAKTARLNHAPSTHTHLHTQNRRTAISKELTGLERIHFSILPSSFTILPGVVSNHFYTVLYMYNVN